MPDVESIVSNLDPAEQKRLLEILTAQLAYNEVKSGIVLTRMEQMVVEALFDVTKSRLSRDKFLRSYGIANFKNRVAELHAFLSDARKLLRDNQMRALVERSLRCLASDLVAREIPVTPTSLLRSMSTVRRAVDVRFPGYAAAGHLHRLAGGRLSVE